MLQTVILLLLSVTSIFAVPRSYISAPPRNPLDRKLQNSATETKTATVTTSVVTATVTKTVFVTYRESPSPRTVSVIKATKAIVTPSATKANMRAEWLWKG